MEAELKTPDGVQQLAQVIRDTRLPPPSERRRIRLMAGVSYRRAADAMGVSAAAVQAWERGQQPRPHLAVIYRRFLDALAQAIDDAA